MSTGDPNSESQKNRVGHKENKKAESTQDIALTPYSPRLLVDSHMHIQSSNTSNLPFLRSNLPLGIPLRRGAITVLANSVGLLYDVGTLRPQRSAVNWALGAKNMDGNYTEKWSKENISDQSSGTTHEVGQRYLAKQDQLTIDFQNVVPYQRAKNLVITGVVMTMDMEYAHLFGYYGIKIYNPIFASEDDMKHDREPVGHWYPKWRSGIKKDGKQGSDNYSEEGETVQDHKKMVESRKTAGIKGTVHGPNGITTVYLDGDMHEAPQSEAKQYETWKKQLRNTEKAVIEGKLKLLPLFHYDPRRWQNGDNYAFDQVGPQGIFLGFKMYTAQGYRPWDPRLPNLLEFYKKCCAGDIPIMNHCTSEGAPTYDRQAFISHIHPNDQDEDANQKWASTVWWTPGMPNQKLDVQHRRDDHTPERDCTYYDKQDVIDLLTNKKPITASRRGDIVQRLLSYRDADFKTGKDADSFTSNVSIGYFTDHFVSPYAWRIVLDKNPSLRLCLAHFGGNKEMERIWGKEIATMMGEKDAKGNLKYPNLYADISSSFSLAEFREHFKTLLKAYPHIKERTLFGTDWYLSLLDSMDFMKYCKTAKKFLDDIDDKLWTKFTQENPARFYRLDSQVKRIAENLILMKAGEDNQKTEKNSGLDPVEAPAKDAKPPVDQTTYNKEIRKKAELIEAIAKAMVT